jgi:hypothetical protein
LVARNIGDQSSVVSGRLSYTNSSGEVAFINVPAVQIAANETKSIDVERAVRQSRVPANVTDTGFEFEYSTPKGSVIMTALSVSRSGNQVFQVPLFNPDRVGVGAGGYPWKASGDYVTKLYIKNETDDLQKYVASLFYEGGDYTLGVQDIKPRQLVAIDFRALRDSQTPDVNGKIIPLNIERGQMAWSSKNKTPRTLSGRSHQSSLTQGVSSTYDCRNHCYNTYFDSWLTYDYPLVYVSDIGNFVAHQQDINSYGQTLPSYPVDFPNWQSTNSTVASIYYTGEATALAAGTTFIQGSWSAERRFGEVGNEECAYESITALVEDFFTIDGINRGRLQAQGPDIDRQTAENADGTTCQQPSGTFTLSGGYRNGEGNISWSWSRSADVTKDEALDAFQCISNALTPTQRANRSQNAFPSATNRIITAPTTGIDAPYSNSWHDNNQPSNRRVDIEVRVGRAFTGSASFNR